MSDISTNIKITPSQAIDFVQMALKASLVPFLRGSPGIGKSDIAKTVAANYGLELIDIRLAQCDPTDLNGFPSIVNGKATYVPMDIFPLENDPLPPGKNGWLIMFDELPSALPAIQAAAYKILLDKMVGMHKLHPNVAMMAAGNLDTDNAIAYPMSTALQSRMTHAELEINFEDWMNWADANNINTFVKFFLKFAPGNLYNFSPDHQDSTYACPRTWHKASNLMDEGCDLDTPVGIALMAGTVGQGSAREMAAWLKCFGKIPDIQTILADPVNTPLPNEMATRFALSTSLAMAMDANNATTLMTYIQRLDTEFSMLAVREAIRKNVKLVVVPAVKAWTKENYTELS